MNSKSSNTVSELASPLLFVNEVAIFVHKITAVDFTEAKPENKNRKLSILLDNGKEVIVDDPQSIEFCIHHFVPERVQSRYLSSIQLARN
jgi:hypothetical protein